MLKIVVKYFVLLGVSYFASVSMLVGGISTKSIVASRTNVAPKIDGSLTENIWQLAVPVSGFKQYDPDEGAPATEATTVKILYDDDALYVGIMCYDSDPKGIIKRLTRRDRSVQADRLSVMVDSYHDQSTAFLFSGAVSGVQSDGILSQDGLMYDVQWDAVWDFEAQILPDGWSAEFKIPYSALRFSEQDGEYIWGINFRRYIARKSETDEWVMVPRKEAPPGTISSVSKMGNLSGIMNIHPPLHIELLPYGVSKANYISQPKPFPLQKEFNPNVGLDLKYGVTNNFIFDVALNPDFGQVEVDKAVLNLTVFETEYPEKRPFFLEGSQIFSFGNSFDNKQLQLLYSRRIGRQPTGYSSIDQVIVGNDTLTPYVNATYSEKPEVTKIIAAGKLSGRTSDGLEVGVLTAITDREEAKIKGINGVHSPPLMVEPRADYNVVRMRQNIWDNSTIGFLATGAFKQQHSPSFSGGIDWNLRFNGTEYALDGYLAGSQVKYSPDQQLSGGAGRLAFGKIEDEHWLLYSAYNFSTKKFVVDDLGYYSQPREHGGYMAISYKEDRADEPLRRYGVTLQTDHRWDWDDVGTLSRLELEPSIQFRNFWQLSLDYIHEFSAFDDENKLSYYGYTPKVSLYNRPSGENLLAILRTDSRQPVEVSLSAEYSAYAKGAKTYLTSLQATIRPTSWMEFNPGITFMKTKNEEAWLIGYYTTDRYALFGERDIDYYDFSLRGTVTFTRDMSLQFFSQVLTAKWRYVNFNKLVTPNELTRLEDQSPIDYFWKVFNANIVFRWEYLPGSAFYLVWTQGRQGYAGRYDQNFLNDFNDIFVLPMDNVLLAKITYWWSL